MQNLEKDRKIIKRKFNNEPIYSKKYLKAERNKINTKGDFQRLYAPEIFIDSVDRKDENHYPIVFFKKYYFIEDKEIYSNSDKEYYNKECINLFLETLEK